MLYAPKQLRQRSIHSGRLERWLGADRIDTLASQFRNGGGPGVKWYGPPVNLADVPGSVWVTGDGDFVGSFDRGFVASAADSLADHLRRLWREAGRPFYIKEPLLGAGFADIPDLIERMRTGYSQYPSGNIQKVGGTGVANVAKDLWFLGNVPVIGYAGSFASGGTVNSKTTTGAMNFNNPSAGTLHLIGADLSASVLNNSVMIYDRIFSWGDSAVTTPQSVTGTPSRYQSTTVGDADYASGNFIFVSVPSAQTMGARNWTTVIYTDQDGNTGITLPTVAGNSAALQAGDLVNPSGTWFCPLASGDTGIKNLTQWQVSVGSGLAQYIAIAHSLGVCMFPQLNGVIPFDWATRRELAPRVFDDACIALMELPKPSTATTTYAGQITLVNAP